MKLLPVLVMSSVTAMLMALLLYRQRYSEVSRQFARAKLALERAHTHGG